MANEEEIREMCEMDIGKGLNLYTDPWMPVVPFGGRGKPRLVSLKDILVSAENEKYEIRHARSEYEMSHVHLATILVQLILPPKNEEEWESLVEGEKTLSPDEYDAALANAALNKHFKLSYFDLVGEKPFMQGLMYKRDPEKHAERSMQKLYPGFPCGEYNSGGGCLYVSENRISRVCAPCAAVMLHQKASSGPTSGGGFAAGLRGNAPLNVMVDGGDIRSTIWANVFSMETDYWKKMTKHEKTPGVEVGLSWLSPLVPDAKKKTYKVNTAMFGFARAMLFQPESVQLVWEKSSGECDVCGLPYDFCARGIIKQQASYEKEYWLEHPYTAYAAEEKLEGGRKNSKYNPVVGLSAKGYRPSCSWESYVRIFPPCDDKADREPECVARYRASAVCKELKLLIGGYAAENSKVLHREFGKCSLFRKFGRKNKNRGNARSEIIMLRNVSEYARKLSFRGFAKSRKRDEHDKNMDKLVSNVRDGIINNYKMEAAHIVERMICAIDPLKSEQEMRADLRPLAESLAKAAERAGEDALEPVMNGCSEYACLLLRRRGIGIRKLLLDHFGTPEELEQREKRRRERDAAYPSSKKRTSKKRTSA